MEKEVTESTGIGRGFWWAASSAAQLSLAVAAYRKGCGDALMPVKAFGVASLFVGAGACAIGGALHVGGIKEVDDLVRVGESIRKGLGAPPRKQA
eukprot:Gb_34030 [translate_table: standard]